MGENLASERDEVSELVHKEAKYTELAHPEDGQGDSKTKVKASGATVPKFETTKESAPDSSVVVDAYELLDSHAVVENISHVVIPEADTKEVQLPSADEVEVDEVTENLDVLKERESSLSLKQVLAFSLPALAGVMTDPLMSFVDTACVGKFSTIELAAMGPNTAIYNFVLQVFTCFIVYTCGQVSSLSSKGAHDQVFKLISHALFLGVATGVVVAAGLIGFSTPLLASLDTLPELMAPAAAYLKIRAVSLPAVLVCMVSGAFCLGRKDSKTPLFAAIATTASVYVGAAYFLWKVSSQIPLKLMIPGW